MNDIRSYHYVVTRCGPDDAARPLRPTVAWPREASALGSIVAADRRGA